MSEYDKVIVLKQIYRDCGSTVFDSTMTSARTTGMSALHARGWVVRMKKTRTPGSKWATTKWRLTERGIQVAKGERVR